MAAISTGGPHGQSVGMQGGIVQVVSSFGIAHTTLGPPYFRARQFINCDRVKQLARRESYYKCTHHDWKMFDFEGRMIPPGPPTSQPLLSSAGFAHYVPLKMRRPSSPYRLARVIVNSFTSLLFGHGRWPTIRVHGDTASEYFVRALAREAKLRTIMIRARAIGGSVGTVGLSWRFFDGKPRVQVHNGKHLHIHEWADREALVPAHVSEIYTYSRVVYNDKKRREEKQWFWYRRDWTLNSDVVFNEVEFKKDEDPHWTVNENESCFHEDGVCHFVWIQNLPEDDDTVTDGQPDYAELYEELEEIDIIKSVVTRGAKLNLDPTLVLKMDPDILSRVGVKKGSDNALVVGLTGDAKYMELAGTSINAGAQLFQKMRDGILESAQCVIPDPNEVAASGASSVAIKIVHAQMITKTDIMREQYGEAIKQLLTQMVEVGRKRLGVAVTMSVLDDMGEPMIDEETGAEMTQDVEPYLDLPPRVVTERAINPETGEEEETTCLEDCVPGEGGDIELDWGEYFSPTAEDKMKAVQTLQLATAGHIMSKESANEEISRMFERNAPEEWDRLQKEEQAQKQEQLGLFADADGSMGGEVGGRDELPEGAEPLTSSAVPETGGGVADTPEPTGGEPVPAGGPAEPRVKMDAEYQLGVSAYDKIVKVNEGRANIGLTAITLADGSLDPDGHLTIAEFAAKRAEAAKALGGETGKAQARAEGLTEPEPAPEASPEASPPAPGQPTVPLGNEPPTGGPGPIGG